MTKRRRRPRKSTVQQTLVDIVIAVHGRIDLLIKCLEAIPEATDGIAYKVIIVDNASPKEDTRELYAELKENPNCIIKQMGQNVGFPAACNLGFKMGKSPLVFFLNSDVILDPKSLMNLILTLDNPQIGVAGMKLVFPEDAGEKLNPNIRPAGKIQHVGLASNVRGEIIHAYVGWSANHPKPNSVGVMYGVTGAALLTRRTLYKKLGGFDEMYGMGTYEDIDYCLKVRDAGYNIVVNPKASAVHYTGATAEFYGMPYPLNENRMKFLTRWQSKIMYTELWSW